MHPGIACCRRLAKDRAPDLVRRDEPSTGALPSNAILRFEKTTHAYHLVFNVQRCPVHVESLFYRFFWLGVCHPPTPWQGLSVSNRG